MSVHYLGNTVPLQFDVVDATTGTLTNPATIVLTLTAPDGTTSTPSLTQDSTGIYHVDLTPAATGEYTYTLTTTAPNGTMFGSFNVETGQHVFSTVTLTDLVDEAVNTLHGVVGDLEQVTELSENVAVGDLTFTVDDASQVSRGLIEVGDELMWVKTTDRSVNTITLNSFGRGFRQSQATTHLTGDMVMNNPLFPRQLVKTSIREVLGSIYPDIFAVRTDTTNTAKLTQITYPLPASCDRVLRVEWQTVGPSQMWKPIRRWKLDPSANNSAFPTGKSIDIYDAMTPGRTIKVTYAAAPDALDSDYDTLGTAGLDDSLRDVLVLGACARMLASVEAGRLGRGSVEQAAQDQLLPPGAAANVAKLYMQLYLTRLQDETARLQALYPAPTHMTR